MKAIYIPTGTKNLSPTFNSINFRDVESYYVELVDQTGDVVATSNIYLPEVCGDDVIRIHFVNALGAIDSINFHKVSIAGNTSSDQWQRPLADQFSRTAHGASRFNVRSNDRYTVRTTDYQEDDMPWIDELFRSPLAWIEFNDFQGDPDSYLPIVILDKKVEKLKEDDRYTYEVILEFELSHETINIRN